MFFTSPLTAETKQINFPSFFAIDKKRFELQLIKLTNKEFLSSKFEVLKLGVQYLERERGTLADNHKWTELT